jgi:hypothetical protein
MKKIILIALFAVLAMGLFGVEYFVLIYGAQNGAAQGNMKIYQQGNQYPTDTVALEFIENGPNNSGKYKAVSPVGPSGPGQYVTVEVYAELINHPEHNDTSEKTFYWESGTPYNMNSLYLVQYDPKDPGTDPPNQ